MRKKFLVISILLLVLTACGSSPRNVPDNIISSVIERGSYSQNVQFAQSQVLFPYGVKVTAQAATLNLLVSTSQTDAAARMEDIEKAIAVIKELVSQNDKIVLEGISISQITGSYAREENSTSNIQNLDASAITLRLTTKLADHNNDFVETVADFNDFLNAIDLPDSLTVNATSVEAELGDLEQYRSQIIAQLYRELKSVKDGHGETVKFEITGLYDPLKKIQLSDSEYYLYLEPVVRVVEF
jgi:hypothetical protein